MASEPHEHSDLITRGRSGDLQLLLDRANATQRVVVLAVKNTPNS